MFLSNSNFQILCSLRSQCLDVYVPVDWNTYYSILGAHVNARTQRPVFSSSRLTWPLISPQFKTSHQRILQSTEQSDGVYKHSNIPILSQLGLCSETDVAV